MRSVKYFYMGQYLAIFGCDSWRSWVRSASVIQCLSLSLLSPLISISGSFVLPVNKPLRSSNEIGLILVFSVSDIWQVEIRVLYVISDVFLFLPDRLYFLKMIQGDCSGFNSINWKKISNSQVETGALIWLLFLFAVLNSATALHHTPCLLVTYVRLYIPYSKWCGATWRERVK